jgi:hypothetical protein
MGEWFYDNVAKEVVLSASDFAGGRGSLTEFKLGFLPKGGKIIQEIYPPLGNNDFSVLDDSGTPSVPDRTAFEEAYKAFIQTLRSDYPAARIIAAPYPEGGLGSAIADRLRRAAATPQ